MTTNKMVAVFLIYTLCQLVCLSVDGQIWGGTGDDSPLIAILNTLTDFKIASSPTSVIGAVVGFGQAIWAAFGKIFLWNYNFLSGYMFVVRLILMSFSAACIISLGQMVWSKHSS